MASAAAFRSLTMESTTIPVPRLITADRGVHWIPLTKENGAIVVRISTVVFFMFVNLFLTARNL